MKLSRTATLIQVVEPVRECALAPICDTAEPPALTLRLTRTNSRAAKNRTTLLHAADDQIHAELTPAQLRFVGTYIQIAATMQDDWLDSNCKRELEDIGLFGRWLRDRKSREAAKREITQFCAALRALAKESSAARGRAR